MTSVNDDARIVNKLDASLTEDARVVIYDCHMFIVTSYCIIKPITAVIYSYRALYYKPIMIVNDDTRIVNKLGASLAEDARVVIYNRHMFIVQATVS
jgi:hypothetical protein